MMWLGPFILSLAVSTGLVACAWIMAQQLMPPSRQQGLLRWLLSWTIKGLLLPLALWMVMNIGVSFQLQPFMPQIQAAQNRGVSWLGVYMGVIAAGMFIIGSCWSALTIGWSLVIARAHLHKAEDKNFKQVSRTWFALMLLPTVGIVLLGGWGMLGVASMLLLVVIVRQVSPILQATKAPPMYSSAIAKIKFGKYAEAEWELIRELEKCEDDFEGWMMMAELYATRFCDLGEA